MAKKILLGLALLALALQFVRPAKNLSTRPPGKEDLLVGHAAPPDVRQLMAAACYDCHSNRTRYPWYAEVQPLGWWLAKHVNDGKDELNLSEFATYSLKTQGRKLDAMVEEISHRAMPLKSYTLVHREAKFTDAQIKLLCDWLERVREQLPEEG